jgi:hypothetical protein
LRRVVRMQSVVDHRYFPAREFIIKTTPLGNKQKSTYWAVELRNSDTSVLLLRLEHLKISHVNSVAVHIHISCKSKHRVSVHEAAPVAEYFNIGATRARGKARQGFFRRLHVRGSKDPGCINGRICREVSWRCPFPRNGRCKHQCLHRDEDDEEGCESLHSMLGTVSDPVHLITKHHYFIDVFESAKGVSYGAVSLQPFPKPI